ncbi:Uncharacterised protein [Yersinia enterocolitica]|nr:Uncharacterised protein [Yersinia enterocolitica]
MQNDVAQALQQCLLLVVSIREAQYQCTTIININTFKGQIFAVVKVQLELAAVIHTARDSNSGTTIGQPGVLAVIAQCRLDILIRA